jgi:hypothetical protein
LIVLTNVEGFHAHGREASGAVFEQRSISGTDDDQVTVPRLLPTAGHLRFQVSASFQADGLTEQKSNISQSVI